MTAGQVGGRDLPEAQARALRKARTLEWAVLAYTTCTIVLVALVMGNSQAMQTAWVEDILSTIPQIAFLAARLGSGTSWPASRCSEWARTSATRRSAGS